MKKQEESVNENSKNTYDTLINYFRTLTKEKLSEYCANKYISELNLYEELAVMHDKIQKLNRQLEKEKRNKH